MFLTRKGICPQSSEYIPHFWLKFSPTALVSVACRQNTVPFLLFEGLFQTLELNHMLSALQFVCTLQPFCSTNTLGLIVKQLPENKAEKGETLFFKMDNTEECTLLKRTRYIEAYKKVILDKLTVELWIIRINYIGLPRSGKTSFLRRILGDMLNIKEAKQKGEKEQPVEHVWLLASLQLTYILQTTSGAIAYMHRYVCGFQFSSKDQRFV